MSSSCFFSLFSPPSALLEHIKFEILMIYWERKRGRGKEGEGRVVAGGFKHDANHLEEGAEVASTACSV